MHDRSVPHRMPYVQDSAAANWLSRLLGQALRTDPVAQAAGFGRWWLAPGCGQLLLSLEAAALLGRPAGLQDSVAASLANVLPEDLSVAQAFSAERHGDPAPGGEFRVNHADDGLRWLRLVALPFDPDAPGAVLEGVLLDITAVRHAAMREQFSYETTGLLIGTQTLDEAIKKVIELVCRDLGWDCGMYWSLAPGECGQLVCEHYWGGPQLAAGAFASLAPNSDGEDAMRSAPRIAPGQGIVGAVWESGQPCWMEDLMHNRAFLFPRFARLAGIESGYAFPVAYDNSDGSHHRPGVLVFFSRLARQRAAQLPAMSAAIGALIAQTTQRIAQQESIRQLAQVDALSGLLNRRHFHTLLETACADAAARGLSMGMLYIDLDRFKPINDALGHEVGDSVLRQFAERLAALLPAGAQAGRVGGDEFAVFLLPGSSLIQLQELAAQVLLAARTRFDVAGRELAISASVGISVFPDNGRLGAELLRHADSAMYWVKRSGRNGVSVYSEGGAVGQDAVQQALVRQLTMEAELLHALDGDQLFMAYQPVFNSADRSVRAVEALIRWRRPNGEIVPPDVFIPIAEQSHLIVEIGRWVIRQACRDLPALQRAGLDQVQMNVNMAALEFLNVKLPQELAAIAASAGIAPRHLCLELTEGMMMNHAEQVIPVMHALREHGFKISIDDFGMGYSSLSRLKDLPISSLKIDRSFVQGLPHDHQDRAIVQTIVDIGRNMGLEVIAEGVETEAQLAHLRQLGCTLVQGYLISRPLPLAGFIAAYGSPSSGSPSSSHQAPPP